MAVGINDWWATGLDTSVMEWFDARRTRRRDREDMGVFRYIGSPPHVLSAAVVCGTALSAWWRSWRPMVLVTGAVGVGVMVEQTLKATIGRLDTDTLPVQYAHSFPSGHVTGTTALLGTIAVCLGVGLGRASKAALAGLVAVCVVVVAYLALYIGAHTCTDVIGGMFLGGAIVALSAAVRSGSGWGSPAQGGARHAVGVRAVSP